MVRYCKQLLKLLGRRETRILWRDIKKLRPEEVVDVLRLQDCCILGSLDIIRERLFRLRLRLIFPNPEIVPWFKKCDSSESQTIFMVEAFAKSTAVVGETSRTNKRSRKPKGTSELSSDSRSDKEEMGADPRILIRIMLRCNRHSNVRKQ